MSEFGLFFSLNFDLLHATVSFAVDLHFFFFRPWFFSRCLDPSVYPSIYPFNVLLGRA